MTAAGASKAALPRDEAGARRLVGVLTGGGDAPGLNAAICGLGRRLAESGVALLGFRDGWRGVIDDEALPIDPSRLGELMIKGGTILGTSSANPYRDAPRCVPRVAEVLQRRGLLGLVAIGGDGTLHAADRLHREQGLPIVGVPKTIDNDLSATDFTFGFFTAVERAMAIMDQLRTTAEAHGRLMVVECMGRHAGWITAYAGVAAAAEVILVPERPVELRELYRKLQSMRQAGRASGLIAVAEGARIHEDGVLLSSNELDDYGKPKTGGAAELVARKVQGELGWEARAMVLGHIQRAGSPLAFDRIFALRLGARAARLVLEGQFGRMAALRNGEVVDVALADAVGQLKTLTQHFLDRYEDFFLPFFQP